MSKEIYETVFRPRLIHLKFGCKFSTVFDSRQAKRSVFILYTQHNLWGKMNRIFLVWDCLWRFSRPLLPDYRFSQAHKKPSDSEINNWSSLEVSVFKCAIGMQLVPNHCSGVTSHVIIGYPCTVILRPNSKRYMGYGTLYAEADYNLTLSHSLVDSELRSPATHPNEDEFRRIFPKLFQKWYNQLGKGKYK